MEVLANSDEVKPPKDGPQEIVPTIIGVCSSVVMNAGGALELACLILFISHFCKKTQYFCTAYFYLLSIGYAVDLAGISCQLLGKFLGSASWFTVSNNFIRWYSGLFLGPWNTLLAVNRCTAILLWNKHPKIWTGPSLIAILILALVYPFLVNGYMFKDTYCLFNREATNCESVDRELSTFEMVSNGINVCVSAGLGIVTALSRRLNFVKGSSENKYKFETHLLIQSLISSIFFGFYCIFGILVAALVRRQKELQVTNSILMSLSSTMASCYYIYFHISATILLFLLS